LAQDSSIGSKECSPCASLVQCLLLFGKLVALTNEATRGLAKEANLGRGIAVTTFG